jgi:hypothetical protein
VTYGASGRCDIAALNDAGSRYDTMPALGTLGAKLALLATPYNSMPALGITLGVMYSIKSILKTTDRLLFSALSCVGKE